MIDMINDRSQVPGHIRLGIPGRFSVYNSLGVLSACMALGVSLQRCADALSSAKGVKGRVETVPTDGDYSVIIDYSHKPDALEKALKTADIEFK